MNNTEEVKEGASVMVLTPYEITKAELTKLAEDYKNLVVSEETFEEAKKARLALRGKRYDIQNVLKHNKGVLNKLKDSQEELANSLVNIILPVEDAIDSGIKTIEKRKEEEKQRKEREEKERIDKINNLLYHLENNTFSEICKADSHKRIDDIIETLKNYDISNTVYQEFTSKAIAIKDMMIAKAFDQKEVIEKKEEQKREAERLEAIRRDQEAKERELKEMQEEVERERLKKEDDLRKALEKEQAEKKAEADRIEAERLAKLKAEQDKLAEEKAEFERQKQAEEDRKAAEARAKKEEEDRIEAERLAKIKEEERLKRQEELRPDKEKLIEFSKSLSAIQFPELKNMDAQKILLGVKVSIGEIQEFIERSIETQL